MAPGLKGCSYVPPEELGQSSVDCSAGPCTRVRLETDCSPADLLYARTLRIPGEFCLPEDFRPSPRIFLEDFREHMKDVRPVPVEQKYKRKVFFHKDMATCTHVLKLVKRVKAPLERPYTGPHKVLERVSDRVYKIDIDGVPTCVSVDHLKPASFVPPEIVDALLAPAGERQAPQLPVLRTYERNRKTVSFASDASVKCF